MDTLGSSGSFRAIWNRLLKHLFQMWIASGDDSPCPSWSQMEERFQGLLWCNSLFRCRFADPEHIFSSGHSTVSSPRLGKKHTRTLLPLLVLPKAADPLTDRKLDRQTRTVPTWLPTLADGYLLFVPNDEAPLLPVFLQRGRVQGVAPG